METIEQRLDECFAEMVAWRRHLHQYPELSFQEKNTSQFVVSLLQQWGLEITQHTEGCGVVGRLQGDLPGPVVALRADMDALPIQDEKDCSYRSRVAGVMHACGHDAHTSVLLALAKVFSERRAKLQGGIVFLFQPAEECSPGGAVSMIEQGAIAGVDVIYGVHLWTPFPVGEAYCTSGPMMAAVDDYTIRISGKGGHGGLPHQTVDSIVVGSYLVVNIQSIVSRIVDPTEASVVTVGSFQGGTSFNVIAENTVLKGTIRTFNEQIREKIRRRMEKMIDSTCSMFDASYHLDFKRGYPAVVNHEAEAERFFTVAPDVFGAQNVHKSPQIMAAEDFAYYLQHIPGCFMFVGAGNNQQQIEWPHHHPRFDIDEESMLFSSKLLARMALHYMHENHSNG